MPHLCPSKLSHFSFFFISLVMDFFFFFASCQVILIDSFSVNSCNFAVSRGGSELNLPTLNLLKNFKKYNKIFQNIKVFLSFLLSFFLSLFLSFAVPAAWWQFPGQ